MVYDEGIKLFHYSCIRVLRFVAYLSTSSIIEPSNTIVQSRLFIHLIKKAL